MQPQEIPDTQNTANNQAPVAQPAQLQPSLQMNATLSTGYTRFSKRYKGVLALQTDQLTFTDLATNTNVFSLTPSQTTSVSVNIGGLTIKTAQGASYNIGAEGSGKTSAWLLGGGILGLLMAKKNSDVSGLPEWKTALQAVGFPQ